MLVENIVTKARSAVTVGHCPIQLGVWGALAKPPETLKIQHFGVPKIGKKTLTFSRILDTNSKKIHIIYRLTGEEMKILSHYTFSRLSNGVLKL